MKRILSSALAMIMVWGLAACSGRNTTTASTMRLTRTDGTVAVTDGGGKDVPLLDGLNLYSGYGVNTRAASYAWISLDDVKLTKMDQESEISIEKEGKALNIELKSGSLFFNVTQPLADDEAMNIRTSTMLVGIRGTSGWMEANDGLSRVYLLEGKVECSAEGQTVQVSAGEFAEMTADGELVVEPFDDQDLPSFVREELDSGTDATPVPDASEPPKPTPTPEPTPEPTPDPTSEPTPEPGGDMPEHIIRRTSDYSPEGILLGYSLYDYDELGRQMRINFYSPEGTLQSYMVNDYDEFGWVRSWVNYSPDGKTIGHGEETCDEQHRLMGWRYYDADGTLTNHGTYVYNNAGQMTELHEYSYFDGTEYHHMTVYSYNDQGLIVKEEGRSEDGEWDWYMIYEYDGNGFTTKVTQYERDGTVSGYSLFEYI